MVGDLGTFINKILVAIANPRREVVSKVLNFEAIE